jgi:hypothetical protein
LLHVPVDAVSADDSCGVPEIVGVAVLLGAACSAAWPFRGTPKTAPTAIAASAMTIAAGHLRFRGSTDIVVIPLVS